MPFLNYQYIVAKTYTSWSRPFVQFCPPFVAFTMKYIKSVSPVLQSQPASVYSLFRFVRFSLHVLILLVSGLFLHSTSLLVVAVSMEKQTSVSFSPIPPVFCIQLMVFHFSYQLSKKDKKLNYKRNQIERLFQQEKKQKLFISF